MKITRILPTALILTGGSISSGLHADSATPEEPNAYEPFLIELTLPVRASKGGNIEYVLDINIDTHTVLVGYLNHGPNFTTAPPYLIKTIELQGLPSGTYSAKIAYIPDLADESLVVNDTGFSFTVAEAPPTQKVYALFNGGIAHYFATASDEEAEGLLAAANSLWEIVDFGFNVWHADDPAPASAVPICRFYSELVNSHFYTGSAEECTLLQEEDHGWTYEGIAFQALLPTDGACPAGTASVWRLYNDRAEQRDSNHRFVASSETYRSMISAGWVGEGVAFCSPPASAL